MKPITFALFLVAGLASATVQAAPTCRAMSGTHKVPVVELYTSEGCSSCPPADRWLSGLKRAAQNGWVVPLAFHVDDWDYIGWKDRFAKAEFSRRQRDAVARQGSRTVYTPQVMIDGRDERGWASGLRFDRARADSPGPAAARVAIERSAGGDGAWRVRVSGSIDDPSVARGAYVHIALFENGLESVVQAGENRGAKLDHDFVVRAWLGPFPVDRSGGIDHVADASIDASWRRAALGTAAIVYSAKGDVLQAVSTGACAAG
ncbi:MAG TPA: DUF1223 domain-containing protein [Rhodocyclaceae bacterium]|nr:DUF1223 domain-containing protein [Rhodocyclaceae bacterium]HMV54292.1 DUF1223 domain-containing protein [Rhodocyclaceae bacterium]HNA05176.1 DUF1223 domain-containing protein [Rhodocyclaceae bacterium]HNB78553.1 DUF1223 domain-containing protein [Rhodocyclaceae bacterium]HNC62869.1 DUF1223 domain-containing protein [Rhodocyclaceae bacterium]